MKNLMTRRSIRQYSDKEVSAELLNRLMTEASRTQTMGNLQLYSVVVTRSPVDHLCRLQPHVNVGTMQKGRAGLRQLSVVYQCGNRCTFVHADAV